MIVGSSMCVCTKEVSGVDQIVPLVEGKCLSSGQCWLTNVKLLERSRGFLQFHGTGSGTALESLKTNLRALSALVSTKSRQLQSLAAQRVWRLTVRTLTLFLLGVRLLVDPVIQAGTVPRSC